MTTEPAAATSLGATTLDLWPAGRMPGMATDQPEKEQPPQGDGVIRLTDVSRPQITVFTAAATSGRPLPAVIVCPGGGYSILAFNKEGTEVAQWLNGIGITAILLKYRVPQNREGALLDLRRAVRLVRFNAARWNIDPKQLGVLGFSAGAHLCARLSTNPQSPAPYGHLDDADDLGDRPDFVILVYPAYLNEEGAVAADLPVTASVPPTLIVHAEDDLKYIEGSRLYSAALRKAGDRHACKLYPTGGHGHGLRSNGAVSTWPTDTVTWLTRIGIAVRES